LEEQAPEKYCLSRKACEGILRRAAKRGKALPPMLKEALEAQAA
jgi:DNA (cytosine-5)-methyltransferase 1